MTRSCFESHLCKVRPLAVNYAMRFARDRSQAEDCVQEACVKAVRASHCWPEPAAFTKWFLQIVYRMFVNELRKTWSAEVTGVIEECNAIDALGDPHDALLRSDFSPEVRRALANLPEHLSELIIDLEVEGMRYHEAAEKFRIPVGTVRSRRHRAMRSLQGALAT